MTKDKSIKNTSNHRITDKQLNIAIRALIDRHGALSRNLLWALVGLTGSVSDRQFDRVTARLLRQGTLILKNATTGSTSTVVGGP